MIFLVEEWVLNRDMELQRDPEGIWNVQCGTKGSWNIK